MGPMELDPPMSSRCPMCGADFKSPETFDRHAQVHVAPTVPQFQCAACNVSFEIQEEYTRHVQGHGM